MTAETAAPVPPRVRHITPKPGYVIKGTSNNRHGGGKIFINVCAHEIVGRPQVLDIVRMRPPDRPNTAPARPAERDGQRSERSAYRREGHREPPRASVRLPPARGALPATPRPVAASQARPDPDPPAGVSSFGAMFRSPGSARWSMSSSTHAWWTARWRTPRRRTRSTSGTGSPSSRCRSCTKRPGAGSR